MIETNTSRVAAGAQSSTLSQDVAFELLSCRRRRYVIHCLKQREDVVELRDLVRQVTAWENDVSPAEVTYDQRMRVYTALRQSHLPKLDEGGVVKFDIDRGTVTLTDAAADLDVYLDVVPHSDISWSSYYVGLGVLCMGFVSGLWLDVVPFSFVSPLVGALLVTFLFTASALFHVRYDRRMRLGSDGDPPSMEVDGWN